MNIRGQRNVQGDEYAPHAVRALQRGRPAPIPSCSPASTTAAPLLPRRGGTPLIEPLLARLVESPPRTAGSTRSRRSPSSPSTEWPTNSARNAPGAQTAQAGADELEQLERDLAATGPIHT
jgi:hypothetical protein